MRKAWTVDELVDFETEVGNAFQAGKINCPVHLSGGNEETLISLFGVIKDQDYVVSTHRNHYHYLLKGGDPKVLMDEILGLKSGCCGGNGRSMHIYDNSLNFYTSGIVAGGCAIAVGIAMGIKKKFGDEKKDRPMTWCFVGDGATDSGYFVEAIRFAGARHLPLTFVVEDNDLAVESTKKDRWHEYVPVGAPNVLSYSYNRTVPHVGIGKHVSF